MTPEVLVGVDVQVSRGCAYYAIRADGTHVDSGGLDDPSQAGSELRLHVERLERSIGCVAIGIDAPRMALPSQRFFGFARGPKDMLDAAIGALVVREFVAGRGCEVGGGDRLGSIILPRPLHQELASVMDRPTP